MSAASDSHCCGSRIEHSSPERCLHARGSSCSGSARCSFLAACANAEFATLKRLEALVAAAEGVFPGAASAKEMDPAATADAIAAEGEAAENAQARAQGCLPTARGPPTPRNPK